MSRSDTTCGHFLPVAPVHAINKLTVPWLIGIKVGAESAAYKGIDDVTATEEELEVKVFEEERQDILRANPLKALNRAVPIFVEFFIPLL